MKKLQLVLPNTSYEEQYLEMMNEWISEGGRLNPSALKNNGASFETWLRWIEEDKYEDTCPENSVPQTLYFAVDENNTLLGAITIRHRMGELNLIDGGFSGYGIRPSQRKKGYAKTMLALGIQKLNERGIYDILLTCDADNIGSYKTILANGGRLENEILNEDGVLVKRFWIHTKSFN